MTADQERAAIVQPASSEMPWFCDRGDFWGTINQLCRCARCGKKEMKRHDEPRRFGGIATGRPHMICDECFDALPADHHKDQGHG